MKTDLFDFELPPDRIALRPATPRDTARLLFVQPGAAPELQDRTIADLPGLLQPGAQSYADLPGGHSEGYDDTFKQVFRRFYQSIADPKLAPEYPQFGDGLRQLQILEAEMASSKQRAWVDVQK